MLKTTSLFDLSNNINNKFVFLTVNLTNTVIPIKTIYN